MASHHNRSLYFGLNLTEADVSLGASDKHFDCHYAKNKQDELTEVLVVLGCDVCVLLAMKCIND